MKKNKCPGLFRIMGLLTLASFSGTSSAERGGWASPEESAATVISQVRIFDGEKVIPADTVIVKNGRIEAVGKDLPAPPGATMIDGRGKTLLPGLIDAHIHTLSPDNLKQCLIFGVTSVIDMFMDVNTMKTIKKLQAEGKAQGMAHLVSPGTLATAPGGHGTQYGLTIPTLSRPEEAPAWVEARLAEGSDFIKIILEDGSAFGIKLPALKLETVKALADEAHRHGKIAVVHACTLQYCLDVLEAGADGLAHIFFNDAFDPEFGRTAARHKAFVIPTLSVLEGMAGSGGGATLAEDPFLSPYLKPQDILNLKMPFPYKTGTPSYKAAEKAVAQLKEAGVPILAGTDAPNPNTCYGASLHGELALLVKAGLTPVEALKAATSLPSEKFSLAGRGRIRPGFAADLLLVKGDPTQAIAATRDIVMVWKEGTAVNRESYGEAVKKEWKAVEKLKNSPPPPNSESGWVSDFEGDKVASDFGAGWTISTDAMMGGKSAARYQLAEGGAEGSSQSLLISGTIKEGSAFRWAGAMFIPGKTFTDPANLSSKKALSFYARGQGSGLAVLIFCRSLGFIPAVKTFTVGPEWTEYVFSWKNFNIEGFDITGIFLGAYQELGDFSLQVDKARLK